MYTLFLTIHIFFGGLSLLLGTWNLLQKKGNVSHKKVGLVFVWGMLITGFSAFILAILKPNVFLFIIGIFTVYLVGTGQRYIHLKKLKKGQVPKWIDWLLTISMMVIGIGFVFWGINMMINGDSMGMALITFGLIGLLCVRKDFQNYRRKARKKMYWLAANIARITGAYIASVTAFLVVNQKTFPSVIPPLVYWLLPTVILTPLIVKWIRKFAKN
jgi:uncharacterized membrane protein